MIESVLTIICRVFKIPLNPRQKVVENWKRNWPCILGVTSNEPRCYVRRLARQLMLLAKLPTHLTRSEHYRSPKKPLFHAAWMVCDQKSNLLAEGSVRLRTCTRPEKRSSFR